MPRNDSGIEVSATLYCSSINNVQRQARFRKRDDLTAKYSNDNSMIKAATSCADRGVLDDGQCPQSRPVHGQAAAEHSPVHAGFHASDTIEWERLPRMR